MTPTALIDRRLRSHRLAAPAASPLAAARHMLAVQAQEFWGGRWALAVRSRGAATMRDVDGAFDRGELVRAWTQRGTLHIIPAADLAWMLSLTADRQLRQGAARHRELGLDDEAIARAERLVRTALRGGNRLPRAEAMAILERGGIDPAGQRGIHTLYLLTLRGVAVLGPVVPREGAPTREQYFVSAEEWIGTGAAPVDPLAEVAVRFVASHGPAGARDLAWWAGLPVGVARQALLAAGERITATGDGPDAPYVAAGPAPRRSPSVPSVLALPPFEEYYLPYADRSVPCAPEFATAVGPGRNGMVRPILVDRGRIVGVWTHSLAVGRHAQQPQPEPFTPTDPDAVAAALRRYAAFVTPDPAER